MLTAISSIQTTGVSLPAFEKDKFNYVLASTWSDVSFDFTLASPNADCSLTINGTEQACDTSALADLPIDQYIDDIVISIFASGDDPQYTTNYTFGAQQQLCQLSSFSLVDFEDRINCTTSTVDSSPATFCVSSSPSTSIQVKYVGNDYCEVGQAEYFDAISLSWKVCLDLTCPFTTGLNQFRVVVNDKINASAPVQPGSINVANGRVIRFLFSMQTNSV